MTGAALPFDQPDVACARTLLRLFRRELDALPFAQQLEHRPPNRAAVEEVFYTAFVPYKAEPLVNEQPCDCSGWHTRSPPVSNPGGYPDGGLNRLRASARTDDRRDAGPAE